MPISKILFDVKGKNTLKLPIYASHALDVHDGDIKRVIVIFHGSGSTLSDATFNSMLAAAQTGGFDFNTLIIAPQLAYHVHLESHFGEGRVPAHTDIMYGPKDGRFFGANSLNEIAQISFFDAIDQLLVDVARSGNFPNVRRLVLVGNSAGGQFVNRYAASSVVDLPEISTRYVFTNASHYLYFDKTRVVPNTAYDFAEPSERHPEFPEQCQKNPDDFERYNRYPHGLETLYPYHRERDVTPAVMEARFVRRDIVHLVGQNDTLKEKVSETCRSMLQGPRNRLVRARIYQAHLRRVFGERRNHQFAEVPRVGHATHDMVNSDVARHFIFE